MSWLVKDSCSSYFTDDLIMAKKVVGGWLPGRNAFGRAHRFGAGIRTLQTCASCGTLPDATIIVDAGVGTASDCAIAMERGDDAVLMNTAIAEARDSAKMAEAMKLAIEAGRLAYEAAACETLIRSASSPSRALFVRTDLNSFFNL